MLVNSHAHLNFYEDSVVESILARAKKAGIEKIINIGTSLEDSKRAIEQAEKYDNVYAVVGLHPNDNPRLTAETVDWEEFKRLATSSNKVVGIGECGLDYTSIRYSVSSIQYKNEIKRQKQLFLRQLELAHELKLPVSIHVRDAYNDMIALAENIRTNAVFHCMSGASEYLNSLLQLQLKLKLDFYFSFAGNITFPPKADQPRAGKNAGNIRQLVQLVPLDRLLVETDCPFLTPEPFRGEQNEPANVKIVAEKLAEIKAISFAELSNLTVDNA